MGKIITPNAATIGQQIKMAMNEREATINSLVQATGVSNTTIMRILQDKEYTISSLKKLVKHLGVSVCVNP